MRPLALIPTILGLAATILTMLCIFAGSKKGLMDDYAIVTLNTSHIGANILNTTSSSSSQSSNYFSSLLHNATAAIENDINDEINTLAKDLGIHDFYTAHLLDYCSGYYSSSSKNTSNTNQRTKQNITHCSTKTSFFRFNVTHTLQQELNSSKTLVHHHVDLQTIHWPTSSIDHTLSTLRVAQKAAFLLYCLAAALLVLTTVFSLVYSLFSSPDGGIRAAVVGALLSTLAFLAIVLASAVTTVVAGKLVKAVDRYGVEIGVVATQGAKFLALTWVASGLGFVCVLCWFWVCCAGKRVRVRRVVVKY